MMISNDRKNLFAKIHIAKKELNMDDDVYRSFLMRVVGQNSCRLMTDLQLSKVLDEFKKAGFRYQKQYMKYSPKSRSKHPNLKDGVDKIRALWIELGKAGALRDRSETGLNKYIKRLTGIDRVNWLNTQQACKVIESLKQWSRRVNNDE